MPPDEDGQQRFVFYDPSLISEVQLALTGPGYFIVMHLDGQHTLADIEEAFQEFFNARVPVDQVLELVQVLDDAMFLDNDRFRGQLARLTSDYRAAEARDNCARWPSPEALRVEIDAALAAADGEPVPGLRGLIAPHLDYERGKPCYAAAYAALRGCPAVRYVILGTNHFGQGSATVATGKDFRTPLGLVPSDRDLLQRIEARVGDLCVNEFDHDREHSIELQVHLLQHVCPGPFEMLGLLIPDPSGPGGTLPPLEDGPDLADVLEALRAELAADGKPTVVIASADLSHVGQSFGDPRPTTDEFLAEVGRSDRAHLDLLAARREEEFVRRVGEAHNPTRICSVGNLYALLRVLPEAECRILRYHQAVDRLAETHVTCAAGVVI